VPRALQELEPHRLPQHAVDRARHRRRDGDHPPGPVGGREQALRQWLTGEALPRLLEQPGISAAHLCEADIDTTTVKTAEKSIRDKPDEVARWVLLVEGIDAGIVRRACADALGAAELERRGAEPGAITGVRPHPL
jgi:hypothetical protein